MSATQTAQTTKEFGGILSRRHSLRMSDAWTTHRSWTVPLTTLYIGLSAQVTGNNAVIAIVTHDGVYMTDFCTINVDLTERGDGIKTDYTADQIVAKIREYEHEYFCKIIGAGVPQDMLELSPLLESKLWLSLDIVPISLSPEQDNTKLEGRVFWKDKSVDEQAESMARKCVMFFGPYQTPTLQVGYRGIVEVDAGLRAQMVTLEDYRRTCSKTTWNSMMRYATNLKNNGTRIAFFSATPQGGGVALMRHALVRFASLIGVEVAWYVPKPRPGVFRITKSVHNTLQGVNRSDEHVTREDTQTLTEWINENAKRYWLSKGGPLLHPSEGGAHIVIVDDPQMPGIIPLSKTAAPDRPVLFRSHIQIRSDLANTVGTPQYDIWEYLWQSIKQADMFISHPIPAFVPNDVPREQVAYLPATTDWLDGLNKDMDDWDQGYYGNIYNTLCHGEKIADLKYPARKYIIQVARFDPSKGIPDVIKAYGEFRMALADQRKDDNPPQLLIVGNGSIDDPDGTQIYDDTMAILENDFPQLIESVSVMRLRANDQLLNTLLSNAHVALQLSTREGFEVKVSEAIHKGLPTIATLTGGIPLQVQHGKNGYLVKTGDYSAVAKHLLDLWLDEDLYQRMSDYAKVSVSDEVGTVGNALSWFYLADKWAQGEKLVPHEKWVNDMARDGAGIPYEEGETRLPRSYTQPNGSIGAVLNGN